MSEQKLIPGKILLADDSITIQKIVHQTFEKESFDLWMVGNGEAAIRKLQELRPDLVLADIFMPGKSGYELCEYIKQQPDLASIPVILLVGAFEPFDEAEATRVRADGHLSKPFAPNLLIETVRRHLGLKFPQGIFEETRRELADSMPGPAAVAGTQWQGGEVENLQSPPLSAASTPPAGLADEIPISPIPAVPPSPVEPAHAPFLMGPEVLPSSPDSPTPPAEVESPLEISFLHETVRQLIEPSAEPVGLKIETPDSGVPLVAEAETYGPAPVDEMEPIGPGEVAASQDIIPESVTADRSCGPSVQEEQALLTEPAVIPHQSGRETVDEYVQFQRDLSKLHPSKAVPGVDALSTKSPDVRLAADNQAPATMEEVIGSPPPPIATAGTEGASTNKEVNVAQPEASSTLPVSEEVIDAIVRRVVEKMSTQVVEDIAWEVVPEVAESMIRKNLPDKK